MEVRSLPPFYCCYLLQSLKQRNATYIGSTPDMRRRLRQHNSGPARGGAVKTGSAAKSPWEVACLVVGFPSSIAALQFEWAWQHHHVSKHIPDYYRSAKTLEKAEPSTVKKKRKGGQSAARMSMSQSLQVLHMLLRVPSFVQWPLSLRFYRLSDHHEWVRICDKAKPAVLPDLEVVYESNFDLKDSSHDREGNFWRDQPNGGKIESIDPSGKSIQALAQANLSYLQIQDGLKCNLCTKVFNPGEQSILVCAGTECKATHHVTCLAREYLNEDKTRQVESNQPIVPRQGHCPCCHTETPWADLIREMSTRIRPPWTRSRKKGVKDRRDDADHDSDSEISFVGEDAERDMSEDDNDEENADNVPEHEKVHDSLAGSRQHPLVSPKRLGKDIVEPGRPVCIEIADSDEESII